MPREKQFEDEAVLRQAMELFWKQGYHATSIDDLVGHTGINRASLYHAFGGKRNLFEQALATYQRNSAAAVRNFLASQSSVKQGFRGMFMYAIDEVLADPDGKGCFVVNTTTELMPGDEIMEQALLQNQALFEEIFYDFLEKGVASGEISAQKNLREVAAYLFMVNNGLKVLSKINRDRSKLEGMITQALCALES